jgi:NitT/TauT family transport system permease protein
MIRVMPRSHAARSHGLARWQKAALTFAGFLLVWELSVRALGIPAFVLPAPTVVLQNFAGQWTRILDHTLVTAEIVLAGYALGILVSIPLALAIAFSPTVQATLYPLLVVFQIIPKIAVAPLFIVWFGFGFLPKIMLVFLLSFFPIVISAIAGFRSLDQDVADLARSTGAGTWKMFVKIRLPQSLPSIFTGLKVAAALAATAAVVAEFVGSDKGLGYLILEYNGFIEIPLVFACIVLLSAIGLALYYAVEAIERLTIPWHVSQQDAETGLGAT